MKRAMALVAAALSALLLVAACGGQEPAVAPTSEGKGKAVFAVTDDAADMGAVTSVKITIDSVRVHASGGAWTSVSSTAQTFDLLELRAKGTAQLLAQAAINAGAYDQMELGISKVLVVDSKGEHEAKLPSNKLQLKGSLDVKADATATANFDFLADQSLHVTGEGRYILAPVIHMETKANATAEIKANNEVVIRGGNTTTDAQVGMNIEGTVDTGLRVSPDAVLSIAASGKVVQTKGQALAVATIKAVDTANGTVTLTTKSGNELVLHLASDSEIKVRGSNARLTDLAANIGAEVITEFDVQTKAISELAASADAKAKADVGAKLDISGTIKAVDTSKGTITIAADSGADVVLKIGADAKLQLDGSTSNLLGLGAKIGSRIEGEVDAAAHAAAGLRAQAEANVTASGTLKGVDVVKGTITITQAGSDTTLEVASNSEVRVNGSLATLASLKALIGAPVTVSFNQQSKVASDLNAQAKAEQSATVSGVIKAVNPAGGTVTITTSGGQEIVLNVTAASSIVADGTISTLVSLATSVGAQVTAQYNTQMRTATSINAQTQGSAFAAVSGTLKAVNVLNNTITITSQAGADVVLNVDAQSRVLLNGSATTLAALATSLGSQVSAEYNAQTKMATSVSAQAQVSASATVSGTLKAVNAVAGTITITAQGGSEVVLNVASDTKLAADGAAATLATLATKIGSTVTAEYNAQTKMATSVSAQAQASASATVSGTLKAVNVLANTVTITAQGGAELVLNLTAQSKILVNGSASTSAALVTMVGKPTTVEYNTQTKAVVSLNIQG